MKKITFKGHYINGKFKLPLMDKVETRKSPGDFEDEIIDFPLSFEETDTISVCKYGKAGYKTWSKMGLEKRKEKLSCLKNIFQKNKATLAEIISRETGKPLWESELEVGALIRKIEITFKDSLERIQDREVKNYENSKVGRVRFKSRGLFLVIAPFNFPMHLAFAQILPALVAGNAVIFKPSEKTPASAQAFAQCFEDLYLPEGVFQMLQGDATLSEKLTKNSLIDGILFVGSFRVGQKIKEATIKDHWKILALEMGGYNSTLIWDYKSRDHAVLETLKSCFLTAGQRCSSSSQILINKPLAKDFIPRFLEGVQKITIDHWKKNPFMGSLIDEKSFQNFFQFEKEISKAGIEILQKGKDLSHLKGYYVSPGVYKLNKEQAFSFPQEETFTPQVLIYEVEDLEVAVRMINHSGYGLALSLFTQEERVKNEIFQEAKVGLINCNLPSCGASSFLPFAGLGKSGNDRPAASFMVDSCVSVLSEQEAICEDLKEPLDFYLKRES